MDSLCVICGCRIHHEGEYAKPTIKGRSHATRHHYVAKRFSSRSNSKGEPRGEPIFDPKNYPSQWKKPEQDGMFCYECHEELLHNPVFLDNDINQFAKLVKLKNLNESEKPENKDKIAGRIVLLHEVIEKGIKAILAKK